MDTRRNHRRSAKTATGNQGCLGNLALSIKCVHLRAHIGVPVEMVRVSVKEVGEEEELMCTGQEQKKKKVRRQRLDNNDNR